MQVGAYVNRSNRNFKDARESEIYVDKTGLLEYTNSVLGTEQRFICSSRPRRFGKSMTASMLSAYYGRGCDSRALFEGLKISGSDSFEKHLNRYDVIYLDMAEIRSENTDFKEAIHAVHKNVIAELNELYPDILKDEDRLLPPALFKVYQKTGSRFIVVIDEWDDVFRQEKNNIGAHEAYLEFLRALFKNDRSRECIQFAYMTGIFPIKKYNNESALNNFTEFTMVRPSRMAAYIGFTEAEVIALCRKYQMDFGEMKRCYDGYCLGRELHVYNPQAVIEAIHLGEIENYWTGTSEYDKLQAYINMNFGGLKDMVVQMFSGGRCKVNVDRFKNDLISINRSDDVLTLLIHLGYLAYDKNTKEAYIPNEEVRTSYLNAIEDNDWTPVIEAVQASDRLLRATWEKDAEAVARGVEQVHMANTSILSYNNENALSCVITLAYYNAVNEYTLIREMPAGKGYADIVFLPRKSSDKPAMIVELKYDKTPESATRQIKERQYPEALKEYQGKVLLVGISYDKESKTHGCVIEEWEREGGWV